MSSVHGVSFLGIRATSPPNRPTRQPTNHFSPTHHHGKKHIISIGYRHYAADSISAATQALALLSKLKRVKRNPPGEHSDRWTWIPDDDSEEIRVEMNQDFIDPDAAPKAKKKALALPAPKRGTILCICERSYVAPKQSCPHCGRDFSESHNRTHGSSTAVPPTLRLL